MSDRESGENANVLLMAIGKAGAAWKEGLEKIEEQNETLEKQLVALNLRLTTLETKLAAVEKIGWALLLLVVLGVGKKLLELI